MKEMNILVLGEAGVGKSTWINAIMNYLTYDSLEEAEKGELKSVTAILNGEYEEGTVNTGIDDNDDFIEGQSTTQFPKSHTFPMGDTAVTLIDTPGIGDLRGIAQDKIHFQRILNHLSYITELHGICIIFKPNHARLNVVFEYCIKEILNLLHRDARKNIVFCFTNARSTFYKSGNTYAKLKKLLLENKDVEIPLSKHTIYSMDNEAFLFLASVKHGILIDAQDRINFSASWDESVGETKRLLDHIQSLTPHTIKDTLSLNDARKLIAELTKPMADVSQNIQECTADVERYKKYIENIDKDRADLAKRLIVRATDLETEKLDYPRNVCGATKCTETLNGVTNFKQVCHENCNCVTGVSTGMKNQAELMRCPAMEVPGGSYCCKCGCPWYEHIHQTYRTKKVFKMVEDIAVKGMLSKTEGKISAINRFIEPLEAKKCALDHDQEVIRKVSLEFASFLHQNAITPYNDVKSKYLDHLIKDEESKMKIDNNRTGLDGLHSIKKSYDEELKFLQQSIASSKTNATVITPQKIDELVKKTSQEILKKPAQDLRRIPIAFW